MTFLCPRARPLALSLALLGLSTPVAYAQFICDIDPWSQTANSGFGAGAGEVRGFAVTPQSVPDECLVGGYSFLTGVIMNVTRTGGATTMPIESVEIALSSVNGPPESTVITSGPGGMIQNVPMFPAFIEDRLPTTPCSWHWDLDGDGTIDNYVAPTAFADGDATPSQFFAYSRNGGSVPCHTGLEGAPIIEPCSDGDPNFRSMGIGVETSAGLALISLDGIPDLQLRTNNPDAAPDDIMDWLWDDDVSLGIHADEIDEVSFFDADGNLVCARTNVPLGQVESCQLTPAQVQDLLAGDLEVEFDEGGETDRSQVIPANHLIFADGFESGDTSVWSDSVP